MDDEFETYQRPSRRLRWQNVLAVVLSGAGAVVEQVGDTLEAVASLLMQDGFYADERAAFHMAAAVELETLLGEVDE